MSRYFYFVFTRAKPGQDKEFNHWYSERHIFDLVAIPGIAAAQRFRLVDSLSRAPMADYLAIYEFSDLELALAGIAERRGTDRMPSTEAIDREASRGVVFRPLWAVAEDWRFGAGHLDLVKFDGPTAAAQLEAGLGRLAAHERQSRPGPPAFDLARFRADPPRTPDDNLPDTGAVHLSAGILPIIDRVPATWPQAAETSPTPGGPTS